MASRNATSFDTKDFRIDQRCASQDLIDVARRLKTLSEKARLDATDQWNNSVADFGEGLASVDAEFARLDKEAKRIAELYEAVKAKLFYSLRDVCNDTVQAVQDEIERTRLAYDRLTVALIDARDFQESVKDVLCPGEADRNARHVALLELRQLHAWTAYQRSRKAADARPVRAVRFNAAKRLLIAEQSMEKFYRDGGRPGEIMDAQGELDEAIKGWKEATTAMRSVVDQAEQPLPNASMTQKLCSKEVYDWTEQGGKALAVQEARARGVDISHHLALWSRSVKCHAVPEWDDSMPEKQTDASEDSVAAMPSELADSWSVVETDSDATISGGQSVRTRAPSVSTVRTPTSRTTSLSACANASRVSGTSSRRRAPTQRTDSSSDESDISFAPARCDASTPNPSLSLGDATLGSLASVLPVSVASHGNTLTMTSTSRGLVRPEEFGDTTLGSLASVIPASRAEQRTSSMHKSSLANFFNNAPDPTPRNPDHDATPLVVEWKNRSVMYAPVRRGTSQGGFIGFIEGLGQGFHVDRSSRFACAVGKSRKVPGKQDEYYAVVTFVTADQAQRCIDYISAEARDFGMTELGEQGAMRMLTAQWSTNEHYNGKAAAVHAAMHRRDAELSG